MRRMKRGLAAFTALAMTITLYMGAVSSHAETGTQSGSCGGDRTWTFDGSSGTLTISGTGELQGFNLQSLKYSWDPIWPQIKTVVIGEGITGLGNRAFSDCNQLTKVTLPDSVTKIEYGAFDGCASLPEVKLPDSVTSIGSYAFSDCSSLTGITLPGNVMLIEYDAFAGCSSLPTVELPSSVRKIEGGAFRGCSSLSSVYFKGKAPEISMERGTDLSPIGAFQGVAADVYYVKDDSWNEQTMVNYGGALNWVNRLQIISVDADSQVAGNVHVIGSGEDAVIECSGALEDFVNVAVDGKVLDPSYYRAESGSTVLTILAAFLDSLSVGDHTVTLNYTYGSVNTVLTVADRQTASAAPEKPAAAPGQTTARRSPQTGERTEGTAWPFVTVCVLGGGAVLLRWKKKSV